MYDRLRKQLGLHSIAFALMSNHVHLVIQDSSMNLSSLIHRLHGWFAQYHNEKYERVGHLFQDRFYSKPCTSDEQLLMCTRYVHLNPWRAGLVKHPKEYPWCSYKLYLQEHTSSLIDAHMLQKYFGSTWYQATNELQRFTEEAMHDSNQLDAELRDYRSGLVGDPEGFISRILPAVARTIDMNVTPDLVQAMPRRDRARLIKALYQLRCFTTTDLAKRFNVNPNTVSRCGGRRT